MGNVFFRTKKDEILLYFHETHLLASLHVFVCHLATLPHFMDFSERVSWGLVAITNEMQLSKGIYYSTVH